ncbi:hypothetical protein MTO96_012202 [Rhipicephalus appendiculatus]
MDKNSPLEQGGERARWEHHHVTLGRVMVAVTTPHFTSGEPSIVISDVLRAGPAEGKLQINDRVVSANGLSLENVDYATAVQVLRECGRTVNLVIKRRVILGHAESVRVTLTRAKKKDDFGIVLGCRIFVKEVCNRSLAERDGTLQEGDIVVKINNTSTEGLSLKEARKLLEASKERLQLVLQREDMCKPSHAHPTEERATNQNLYVQQPTRADDKNNLSRFGRNRGPLMDSSQLDPPETPPRPMQPRMSSEYGHDGEEDPLARRSATNQKLRIVSACPCSFISRSVTYSLKKTCTRVGVPQEIVTDNSLPFDGKEFASFNASWSIQHHTSSPHYPRSNEQVERAIRTVKNTLCMAQESGGDLDMALLNYRATLMTTLPSPAEILMDRQIRTLLPVFNDLLVGGAEPRLVCFHKESGSNVGLRLTGGNQAGVFVTAVQPGSPASLQGLQPGDRLLKAST